MKKKSLKIFLALALLGSSLLANERPKIGLVFSGGGAKGFSQIPVLKTLDSLQIPVDYIAGTSMGGILGALYAMGYSGLEIEKLVHRSDWQAIFTDQPPRQMLPFFQKQLSGKYQLQFGIKGFKPLPQSGLIYGQKISLLFSSLTLPFERIENFNELPIPFRCVAVDLVTGREVHLSRGSLSRAMRATMSIPTYFSPVQWGDSLLVDGGLVNNLPVDVVKQMGADIVIAIDVGTKLKQQHELNSALSILQQTIAMQGREKWRKNIEQVDILVRPLVTEFSAADFNDLEIRKIIDAGQAAVTKAIPDLVRLKEKYDLLRLNTPGSLEKTAPNTRIHSVQITGNTTIPFKTIYQQLGFFPGNDFNPTLLKSRLAELRTSDDFESIAYEVIPHSETTVRILLRVRERARPIIANISVAGNKNFSENQILNMFAFNPGDTLDTETINQRIMEIYANGDFELIHYEVEGIEKNRVNLKFIVKELPFRRLNVGFKYNNQYQLLGAVRVKLSNVVPSVPGLNIESEWQVAGLYRFYLKIYHPYKFLGLPVYPFIKNYNQNVPLAIFDKLGHQIAEYRDIKNSGSLGIGLTLKKSINTELEFKFETSDFQPDIAFPDTILFPTWQDSVGSTRLQVKIDQLDDVLLPKNGYYFQGNLEGGVMDPQGGIEPFFMAEYALDLYKTFRQKHTFRFFHYVGQCSPETPIHKYLRNRSPEQVVGFRFDQLLSSNMTIFRLDYRYQFRKNIYFNFMSNLVVDLKYRQNFTTPATKYAYELFGMGFGITLVTPIGPLQYIQSVGDKKFAGPREAQDVRYISLGYKF